MHLMYITLSLGESVRFVNYTRLLLLFFPIKQINVI